MAIIKLRVYENRNSYQIQLRRKGKPTFSLTFESLNPAIDWLEENEKKFYEDPDYYFDWREELSYIMKREDVKIRDHILRPLIRRQVQIS